MERSGIERSHLSVSSPGVHFGDDEEARVLTREVSEFGARVRAEHPRQFGHFASLPLPDGQHEFWKTWGELSGHATRCRVSK